MRRHVTRRLCVTQLIQIYTVSKSVNILIREFELIITELYHFNQETVTILIHVDNNKDFV